MNTTGYVSTAQSKLYPKISVGSVGSFPSSDPQIKTTGIQYELDGLRNAVNMLRDAVLQLDSKVAPVSFPRPPIGNASPAPKPLASLVGDIINAVRGDIIEITDIVHCTRNGLDL